MLAQPLVMISQLHLVQPGTWFKVFGHSAKRIPLLVAKLPLQNQLTHVPPKFTKQPLIVNVTLEQLRYVLLLVQLQLVQLVLLVNTKLLSMVNVKPKLLPFALRRQLLNRLVQRLRVTPANILLRLKANVTLKLRLFALLLHQLVRVHLVLQVHHAPQVNTKPQFMGIVIPKLLQFAQHSQQVIVLLYQVAQLAHHHQ